MKYIVTADLQFDQQPRMSIMTSAGISSRLQDRIDCWRWIVRTAVKKDCEGIIVVGDIFDSRTSIELPVIHHVCSEFYEASKDITLYLVPGNHDSYLRNPSIHSLRSMAGFATIADDPTFVFDSGGKLGFVPWTEDEQDLKDNIDFFERQGVSYAFTHVLLEGAAVKGKGVPAENLELDRFKRVFLGDVHQPTKMSKTVEYVGAPMQMDFRDAGGKRGIVLLNTDANKRAFIENTFSPRFHVVSDKDDLDGVRDCDFVRIKPESNAESSDLKQQAQEKTTKVESHESSQSSIEQSIRLDLSGATSYEDMIRTYVRASETDDDPEMLISTGLSLLQSN